MSFADKPLTIKFVKPFHNPPISLRPLPGKSNDKMRGKLFAQGRPRLWGGLHAGQLPPQANPHPIDPPRWTNPAAGTILDLRRSTSRITPVWIIIRGWAP